MSFCAKLATILISIEKFYLAVKENKKIFAKKIRGFVENMSRTCKKDKRISFFPSISNLLKIPYPH